MPSSSTTGAGWAQEAHRRLGAAGYRSGGAREAVIDLLADRGGCLTAQEIVDHLRDGRRSVGAASVYRCLATLRELALLTGADHGDGVRYELVACDGAHDHHHHHLVCAQCGADERFVSDALEQVLGGIAAQHGALLVEHEVLLRVRCARCRASASETDDADG